jgi:hypothetical protein
MKKKKNFFIDGFSQSAERQLEIQAEAQSAFFIGVVLVRMVVLLVCKTKINSLFKQSFR